MTTFEFFINHPLWRGATVRSEGLKLVLTKGGAKMTLDCPFGDCTLKKHPWTDPATIRWEKELLKRGFYA